MVRRIERVTGQRRLGWHHIIGSDHLHLGPDNDHPPPADVCTQHDRSD
ncbi:MAG: hypothetical protein R2710_19660 [Acidimicrobiales bacterium]